MISIKVLGPGCAKCTSLLENVKRAVAESGVGTVEWAQRAVDLDGGKAATAWDTLGAAKANAGDFAGAIQAAAKIGASSRIFGPASSISAPATARPFQPGI